MENAVDALKLAFGVIVFVIAFALLFSTVSLAKRVTEGLVTEADETTYMLYDEANGDDAWVKTDNETGVQCRIVTMEDIIPTLYRYSTESYGVTIIDKSKRGVDQIIARFDTETESHCNNWKNSDYGIGMTIEDGKTIYRHRTGLIMHLNKYVLEPVKAYNLKAMESTDLEALFKRIYNQKTDGEYANYSLAEFSCPWTIGNSIETQEKFVAQRLNSDLSRKFYNIFRKFKE